VRTLRLVVGVGLAVLAVLVALLAADVRSWPAAFGSGDALEAASPSRASWTPSTHLGGLTQNLLGLEDDLQLRRALQLYRESGAVPQRLDDALAVETARAAAQEGLTSAARGSPPEGASQALTLLGILAFRSVAAGGGANQTDAALADLTDAVRLDPGNELAKYDLELLLRLGAAHGVRSGAGQSSGFGRGGRRGGGGGLAGGGY
jgi:hypothetical protein